MNGSPYCHKAIDIKFKTLLPNTAAGSWTYVFQLENKLASNAKELPEKPKKFNLHFAFSILFKF